MVEFLKAVKDVFFSLPLVGLEALFWASIDGIVLLASRWDGVLMLALGVFFVRKNVFLKTYLLACVYYIVVPLGADFIGIDLGSQKPVVVSVDSAHPLAKNPPEIPAKPKVGIPALVDEARHARETRLSRMSQKIDAWMVVNCPALFHLGLVKATNRKPSLILDVKAGGGASKKEATAGKKGQGWQKKVVVPKKQAAKKTKQKKLQPRAKKPLRLYTSSRYRRRALHKINPIAALVLLPVTLLSFFFASPAKKDKEKAKDLLKKAALAKERGDLDKSIALELKAQALLEDAKHKKSPFSRLVSTLTRHWKLSIICTAIYLLYRWWFGRFGILGAGGSGGTSSFQTEETIPAGSLAAQGLEEASVFLPLPEEAAAREATCSYRNPPFSGVSRNETGVTPAWAISLLAITWGAPRQEHPRLTWAMQTLERGVRDGNIAQRALDEFIAAKGAILIPGEEPLVNTDGAPISEFRRLDAAGDINPFSIDPEEALEPANPTQEQEDEDDTDEVVDDADAQDVEQVADNEQVEQQPDSTTEAQVHVVPILVEEEIAGAPLAPHQDGQATLDQNEVAEAANVNTSHEQNTTNVQPNGGTGGTTANSNSDNPHLGGSGGFNPNNHNYWGNTASTFVKGGYKASEELAKAAASNSASYKEALKTVEWSKAMRQARPGYAGSGVWADDAAAAAHKSWVGGFEEASEQVFKKEFTKSMTTQTAEAVVKNAAKQLLGGTALNVATTAAFSAGGTAWNCAKGENENFNEAWERGGPEIIEVFVKEAWKEAPPAREVVPRAVGGAAGSYIGGAIGTFFLPGIGTVVGGFIGGLAGDWVGSKI